MRTLYHKRPGAMLLITVLIVGSLALFISLGVAVRGIGELDAGLAESQSLEAFALSDGCVQETLLRLSQNSSYTGGTYVIGDGSCTITVSGGGSTRAFTVDATVRRWTHSISGEISLSAGTELLYWKQER